MQKDLRCLTTARFSVGKFFVIFTQAVLRELHRQAVNLLGEIQPRITSCTLLAYQKAELQASHKTIIFILNMYKDEQWPLVQCKQLCLKGKQPDVLRLFSLQTLGKVISESHHSQCFFYLYELAGEMRIKVCIISYLNVCGKCYCLLPISKLHEYFALVLSICLGQWSFQRWHWLFCSMSRKSHPEIRFTNPFLQTP